jgi:DNA-binding MarR family transcriptional regulator
MGPSKEEYTNDGKILPTLDKLIHEPARLKIIALLYVVESADFLFIMRQTDLTYGNLSSHMSKLEDAGYIEIVKDFIGRKPHTMLRLTAKGQAAFEKYRKQMKQLINGLPE